MKLNFYTQPRKFYLKNCNVTITDYGKVNLESDEMVSFQTPSGHECDFTAKNWGFYPASSLNSRLKKEGFKTALVRNSEDKIYINIVEKDKVDKFNAYLKSHSTPPQVICWLDELTSHQLDVIESTLKSTR